MSQSSGLPYWYSDGPTCPIIDSAIISRYPMYNKARIELPSPVSRLVRCDEVPWQKKPEVLQAWVNINGIPHRFYSTHWTNALAPWNDFTDRITSAEKSLSLITSNPTMAFYGGDLNECRPSSKTDPNNLCTVNGGTTPMDAPGTAVGKLLTALRDPLMDLRSLDAKVDPASDIPPRVSNCDAAPIDDVFYRTNKNILSGGPYEPVEYNAICSSEKDPSDHPFVLVAFERTTPWATLEPPSP